MPLPETSHLYQKAVYWAASTPDDYGNMRLSAKEEINVRWDEKRQDAMDANGNTITIDATAIVDREVACGSVLWLGDLDDLPDTPTNLKQVVNYTETPDIKARAYHRVVMLKSLSDTLPTVV